MTKPFEISGAECVLALLFAGFRVQRRAEGNTVLTRGERTVIVPSVLILPAEVFDSILTDADLTQPELVALLTDVPTRPGLNA
jgi:hypothetical protein